MTKEKIDVLSKGLDRYDVYRWRAIFEVFILTNIPSLVLEGEGVNALIVR